MVNPRIMCRQHLLGEHVEIHMYVGAINRGQSMKGYLQKGLLEVHSLYDRHEEIVEEMKQRGYKHHSDLAEKWKSEEKLGFIDRKKSLDDLVNRCSRCNRRYSESEDSLL